MPSSCSIYLCQIRSPLSFASYPARYLQGTEGSSWKEIVTTMNFFSDKSVRYQIPLGWKKKKQNTKLPLVSQVLLHFPVGNFSPVCPPFQGTVTDTTSCLCRRDRKGREYSQQLFSIFCLPHASYLLLRHQNNCIL